MLSPFTQELDGADETRGNYRTDVKEGIAWLLQRLQRPDPSLVDRSVQTTEEFSLTNNSKLLQEMHLRVLNLRREQSATCALVQQYRDAWKDVDRQELEIVRYAVCCWRHSTSRPPRITTVVLLSFAAHK